MNKQSTACLALALFLVTSTAGASGFDLSNADFEPVKTTVKKAEKKKKTLRAPREQKPATASAPIAVQQRINSNKKQDSELARRELVDIKDGFTVKEIDCGSIPAAVTGLLDSLQIVFEKDALISASGEGTEFAARSDLTFTVKNRRYGLVYGKLDTYGLSIARALADNKVVYAGTVSQEPLGAAQEVAGLIGEPATAIKLWADDRAGLAGGAAGFYLQTGGSFITCKRSQTEVATATASRDELVAAIKSAQEAAELAARPVPITEQTLAAEKETRPVDDGTLKALRLGAAR